MFFVFTAFFVNACMCFPPQLDSAYIGTKNNIALIRIHKLIDYKNEAAANDAPMQLAAVEQLYGFKGKRLDTILVTSVRTSCDIGVREGDLWLVFTNALYNYQAIGACGNSEKINTKFFNSELIYLINQSFAEKIKTLLFLYYPAATKQKVQVKWKSGNTFFTLPYTKQGLNGELQVYSPEGKLLILETYKNDQLNGVSKSWYYNGTPNTVHEYKDGKRNGTSAYFFPNGSKAREEVYENEELNGLKKTWDLLGNLTYEGTYRQGLRVGVSREWHAVDTSRAFLKMQADFDYYGENLTEDTIYQWNQSRQLKKYVVADSVGVLQKEKSFYRNGRLESDITYDTNTKNYLENKYFYNGRTKYMAIYKIPERKTETLLSDRRYLMEEYNFNKDGSKKRVIWYDADGKRLSVIE